MVSFLSKAVNFRRRRGWVAIATLGSGLLGAGLLGAGLSSCGSSAQADPQSLASPLRIYPVSERIVAVELEVGRAIRPGQVPYKPQAGDRQLPNDNGEVWLQRDGKPVGVLVGRDRQWLSPVDAFVPGGIEPTHLDVPTRYRLRPAAGLPWGATKPNPAPERVYRKTKPTDMAMVGVWDFRWPQRHTLYLEWDTPLTVGQTYTLEIQGDAPATSPPHPLLARGSFTYAPDREVSEAVQVSQIGFRPDDPVKVGFLSTWMGNGGGLDYSPRRFQVIDTQSRKPVYSGQTHLSRAATQPEDPRNRNYNLTSVYRLDFSPVRQPGRYQVCVEQVGCSIPFAIAPEVWQTAFITSARGFYHQRSGIELKPPYTHVQRPRPFHPADGVKVYQSTTALMDVDMGIGEPNAFKTLLATRTDQLVPEAWGGYFDAGDWDRRIHHVAVPRVLLELVELFPDYFAQINLNIPESTNQRPDLLDEALWGVDFFRRMQLPNGGVRGGVESAAHPRRGEASWQESLPVMAYAPDAWSSYLYAGVAARAAVVLSARPADAKLAQTYRESALKAMAYAETQWQNQASLRQRHQLRDARNLAAVELYRLTSDRRWHEIFLATTLYRDPNATLYQWDHHDQRDAVFVYLRLPTNQVDPLVRRHALAALRREADASVALGQQTGFGWTKLDPGRPIGWGGGWGDPQVISLLRLHTLTQESRYLEAAVRACQFTAGANPMNLSFTSGVGVRSPRNLMNFDARVRALPPPPGITIYGPLDIVQFPEEWPLKLFAEATFPPPWNWPIAEGYFDVFLYPSVTELTISETMAPTAYAWGYLAARP